MGALTCKGSWECDVVWSFLRVLVVLWRRLVRYFLKYLDIDAFKFSRAPDPARDFGGHGSKLQEWSAPLKGAVLGVRRNSKAPNAMLEHCRVPLAQRGRMSGLVRDMLTR